VLVEAHRRMVTYDKLLALAEAPGNAADKLRAFIGLIIRTIVGPASSTWALRVLSREILSPTPLMGPMLSNQVAPKAKLVRGMVGEMLGLPPAHPAVSRTVVSLIGPCVMLLMVNREVLGKVLPSLDMSPQALVEHLVTFALAGMKAVASKEKATRGRKA
jgi:hypothetical protein